MAPDIGGMSRRSWRLASLAAVYCKRPLFIGNGDMPTAMHSRPACPIGKHIVPRSNAREMHRQSFESDGCASNGSLLTRIGWHAVGFVEPRPQDAARMAVGALRAGAGDWHVVA